jgi:SAM-dependent methyltransferase
VDRRQVLAYYENPAYVDQNLAHSLPHRERKAAVLREWMNEEGAVVELGCGAGVFSGVSPRYLGLDISLEAVRRFGRGIVCDVAHLPLKDGVATTAFSFNVLEHVPDPARVIREVDRVLARGGVALLKDAWLKASRRASLLPRWPVQAAWNIGSKLARIARCLTGSSEVAFTRLTPDYSRVGEDSDAVSRIDPHSVFRWFRARGYEAVNERRGPWGIHHLYRSHRHWVIVRKK